VRVHQYNYRNEFPQSLQGCPQKVLRQRLSVLTGGAPVLMTDADIRKLLSMIDDPRDQAIVVLVLSTGLFLSELISLDVTSVNFGDKTLSIEGKRKRTVSLTDSAITALNEYLEVRPKTPEVALFVTERGIPKRLSDRSIDHTIRTASKAADLTVSYHDLRNTFIARLLKKTDIKEAAKRLGVDRETLERFRPMSDVQSPTPDNEPDPLDTRSPVKKLIDVIHPPSEPISTDVGHRTLDVGHVATATFGRDPIIKKTTDLVMNTQSVLFTGPTGIGKTHLLKTLATTIPNAMFIDSPVPFKTLLLEIAEVICPSTTFTQRTPSPEILDAILSAEILVPPIIIIDNLDRLKTSEEDAIKSLIDRFPVIAAMDKLPTRLKSVGWKFKEIELPPLNKTAVQSMITVFTQGHSMNPKDYKHLETKILNLANGNPFAVVELINQLPESKKVTVEHIRKIDHEAGIIYRDWSWMLMGLWMVLVISRFIALGTHSFEGYILAGVGTTVFVFFKYLVRLKR